MHALGYNQTRMSNCVAWPRFCTAEVMDCCPIKDITSLSGVQVDIQTSTPEFVEASASAVGLCMSEFMENDQRVLSANAIQNSVDAIANIVSDVAWMASTEYFRPIWHTLDAARAYMLYVFSNH